MIVLIVLAIFSFLLVAGADLCITDKFCEQQSISEAAYRLGGETLNWDVYQLIVSHFMYHLALSHSFRNYDISSMQP